MSKAAINLAALAASVETTLALIAQLLAATKIRQLDTTSSSVSSSERKKSTGDINILDLAHDAASLIKAHSTKLSLLIINEPFTPTAISTVLREITKGPLPALATAVELCDSALYTNVVRSELQWRTENVYTDFSVLVRTIPLTGKILSMAQKNGTGATTGKGSLASTGIVWKSCDNLMDLKRLGIAGVLAQKVEQYRDTLKDALEELREWGEETSDDEDEVIGSDEDVDAAQAAIDNIFSGQRHIPRDDTEKVRERLESSLRRLKLVTIMYQAVVKRRLKILLALPHPPLPVELASKSNKDLGIVQTLNEVMSILKKIPDIADELASAFYELNTSDIDKRMDECFFAGFAAAELLVLNWEGQKDEFTAWAFKFQMAMKKS